MANRNRPAIDVEQFVWNAQFVTAIQDLHGKCFVQFPDANIVHLEAKTLQQFGDCEHGANAHFVRLRPCNSHADITAKWVETLFLRQFCFHQDGGG